MRLEVNTVPGTCHLCGEIVRRGEGLVSRARTSWKTWHRVCAERRIGKRKVG